MISRFIKLIFTILLIPLTILVLTVTMVSTATVNVLTDKAAINQILTSDIMIESYREYLIERINQDEEIAANPDAQQSSIEIVESIDSEDIKHDLSLTIDQVYLWLEGKEDNVCKEILKTLILESDILKTFTEKADPEISRLINQEGLVESIVENQVTSNPNLQVSNQIPQFYQNSQRYNSYLQIASGVLLLLMILSYRNVRHSLLITGITIGVSGFILLFPNFILQQYIQRGGEIQWRGIDLESIDLPLFAIDIINSILENVITLVQEYAVWCLGIGIIVVILSQLAIRRVDVEDDDDVIVAPPQPHTKDTPDDKAKPEQRTDHQPQSDNPKTF